LIELQFLNKFKNQKIMSVDEHCMFNPNYVNMETILFLLWIAISIISSKNCDQKCKDWFMSAVDEVLYKNNPVSSNLSGNMSKSIDVKNFDMWDVLGVPYGGYSESLDKKIIDIIKCHFVNGIIFPEEISKKLSIHDDFVKLVFYMLSNTDMYDYGCSPRGLWCTNKEKAALFIKNLEDQYEKSWSDI
jgi:hypothetical protein